jgi:membrane protease YdiL (CAAX protease family)
VFQQEDIQDIMEDFFEWSAAHTDFLKAVIVLVLVFHGVLILCALIKREWIKTQLRTHTTVEKWFIISFFVTVIEGVSVLVVGLVFVGLQGGPTPAPEFAPDTFFFISLGVVVILFLVFVLAALVCFVTFLILCIRLFIEMSPLNPVIPDEVNWGGTPVLVVVTAFFLVSLMLGFVSEVLSSLAGSLIFIAFPVFMVLKPYKRPIRVMGFKKPILTSFVLSFLLVPVLLFGSDFIYWITEKIIGEFPLDELVGDIVSESPLLMSVHLGIVGPIGEEVFFRGFAHTALKRKYGFKKGILLSSLFFGVYHGLPWQIPYAVVAGVLLAYSYEKTQSLYTPIMLHIINNGIAVIFIWM